MFVKMRSKNDDDAVFCVSCGAKIGESQAEVNNLSKEIVWEMIKLLKK